jgi:hypothetical protein
MSRKIDLNDALKRGGLAAVQACIADAKPPEPAGLRAYYDGPTAPRYVEMQRQTDAIHGIVATAALRAAVGREVLRRRAEDPDYDPDAEPGQRGAITRRITRAVLKERGLRKLPAARRTLITGSQGSRKTGTFLREVAAVRSDMVAWLTAPDLSKAAEAAEAYREVASPDSLPVMVIRGRSADDPHAKPGTKMCPRHKPVQRAAALDINVRKEICKTCPLKESCGTMRQDRAIEAMNGRGLFIMAADYLFLPCAAPPPDLFGIDECVTIKAIDEVAKIDPDHVRDPAPYHGSGLAAVIDANLTVNAVIEALMQPKPLTALRAAGIDRERLKQVCDVLDGRAQQDAPPINGKMTDVEIEAALDTIEVNKAVKALVLLRAVLREIDMPRDTLTGALFDPQHPVKVDGKTERQPRVLVYRLQQVRHIKRSTSLVVMDGTGSERLNTRLLGKLDHVHVRIERDATVIGTIGKSYSRQSITGEDANGEPIANRRDDAAKLRADLVKAASHLKAPLVVSYKAAMGDEAKPGPLAELLPDDTAKAHFGALRGRNTWDKQAACLAVGRIQPSIADVENLARAYMTEDDAPFVSLAEIAVPADWKWKKGWPFRATRGRRMRDGSVQPVEVEVHPDPRVQEVLEQIRESEIVQAVDRVRPLDHHCDLSLANQLCVDVTYDRIWTHDELVSGGPLLWRLFHAYGILPLGGADLYEAYRTEFVCENAASCTLKRAHGKWVVAQIIDYYLERDPLVIFRYRRRGQTGSDSRVLVDLGRHPDARAAVEEVLGELVLFEPVSQPPPQPEPQPEPEPQPSAAELREKFWRLRMASYSAAPDLAEEPSAPPPPIQPSRRRIHRWPLRTPGRSRRRRLCGCVVLSGAPDAVRPWYETELRLIESFDDAPDGCLPFELGGSLEWLPPPKPAPPSPEQVAKLKDLTRRLAVARPPWRWGDEFDALKEDHWRSRMAAAQERRVA